MYLSLVKVNAGQSVDVLQSSNEGKYKTYSKTEMKMNDQKNLCYQFNFVTDSKSAGPNVSVMKGWSLNVERASSRVLGASLIERFLLRHPNMTFTSKRDQSQ